MVELLATVVMIAILATVASPSFISLVRDRRISQTAIDIGSIYRSAKARSLGRGAAILVRYDAKGGADSKGAFNVREAVVAAPGSPIPTTSCLNTDWADTSTSSRAIASLDLGGGSNSNASFAFLDSSSQEQSYAEICFTPRGRTFARYKADDAFSALTGVPRIEVKNNGSGFVRTVFTPPNGIARLAL